VIKDMVSVRTDLLFRFMYIVAAEVSHRVSSSDDVPRRLAFK
jgi:hypothetical protein